MDMVELLIGATVYAHWKNGDATNSTYARRVLAPGLTVGGTCTVAACGWIHQDCVGKHCHRALTDYVCCFDYHQMADIPASDADAFSTAPVVTKRTRHR